MWLRCIATVILLLLGTRLQGAEFLSSPGINFYLTNFSKYLTQQTVTQTFQDSHGALWFLTQEGLNRYNGIAVENYRYSKDDDNSISANSVTRMTEDADGNLWISTLGGGLNKYDPISNGFTNFQASENLSQSPISNNIHTVFTANDGRLWLGYRNGFSIFDPVSLSFKHYSPSLSNIRRSLGVINHFSQSANGHIWMASLGSGLIEFDPQTEKLEFYGRKIGEEQSLVSNDISRVIVDRNDLVWAASESSGLSVYNPKTKEFQNHKYQFSDEYSLSSNEVYDVFEDAQGQIWVGTYDGLNIYNRNSSNFNRYDRTNTEIPSNRIHSLYQSNEGQYWIGTFSGLASGAPTLFNVTNTMHGNLSSDSVNAFTETFDGSLWVGTDQGLNRLRPNKQAFEWVNESTNPKISSSDVMSLLADNKTLWVGTFNGGLNRIDLETNASRVYTYDSSDPRSIGANGITSIIRTTDGNILVGTYGGGLNIYNPERDDFTRLKANPSDPRSLNNNMVIAIFEDSLNKIWVGTENGLHRYEPSTSTFDVIFSSSEDDGISSNIVWAFHEDIERNLWLGTRGGGLNMWAANDRKINNLKFKRYTENISLPSSNIYGISSDKNSNIWVSHSRGVTRFNPTTLNSRNYGKPDGLQDTEFNMGAVFTTRDGLILFGGNRGYNVINAEAINEDKYIPRVSIRNINVMNERRLFDKPYHQLENITLDYEDKMLTVEFFAADFTNPDAIEYAYKLDGLSPDWYISPDAHTALFTTLPAGNYTLRLAATDSNGTWNWDAIQIPITVTPPPWRSNFAYSVYGILVALSVLSLILRQKAKSELSLRRQKELEKKVSERTADLQQARLAAENAVKVKADFLATMSHEIRTPMHGMIGMTELLMHTSLDDQQKKFAHAAHSSGEALLSLINSILDFSKAEAEKVEVENIEFSFPALIDEVCYLQAEPASRKNLQIHSIFDISTPEKVISDPTKIRQIVMNLVGNAIKFTESGYVNVKVHTQPSTQKNSSSICVIQVEDSGIGIDEDTQKNIFEPFTQADATTTREYGGTGLGLAISRNYIGLLDGSVEITSELGEGTIIRVEIPLQITQPLPRNSGVYSHIHSSIYSVDKNVKAMMKGKLQRIGFQHLYFWSEGDEIDLIEDGLVILDDSLPKIIADQLFHQLEKTKYSKLKIVSLDTIPNARIATSQNRHWNYLVKPFSTDELKEVIESHLENSPLEENKGIANAANKKQGTGNTKILVAEDMETNQRIAQEMLQLLGCQVDIANNGLEAVKLFKENDYDLIFMDCQMPVMDGYESSLSIRDLEKKSNLSTTPIIALTAGFDRTDERRCLESGMNHYLRKPFTLNMLSETLSKYTHHSFDVNSNGDLPRDGVNKDQDSDDTIDLKQIIDYTALDNIRELERQTKRPVIVPVYDGFLSQMDEKLEELERVISTLSSEETYKTAHAIKSMSANIGAKQVRRISADIEKRARSGDTSNLNDSFEILQSAYHQFQKTFKSEIIG